MPENHDTWMERNRAPHGGSMATQRISELLVRITPSLQQEFFRRWISANKQDNYYAMDITSVSSYSDFIEFVRWGYNRNGKALPQINLLMLTGEKSRMPVYYRIIPGSIRNVSTLRESIKNLELFKTGTMHFVMDKGFYSEKNIDALYDRHMKFLVGVPFTAAFAKNVVEEYRDIMRSHHNYCMVMDDELYAVTNPMTWDGHRFYAHVYFDSYKAEPDSKKFDHLLLCCHDEPCSGMRVKEHEKYYENYFFIKETPVRGIKVSYNEDTISGKQEIIRT